jgi:NRAMP (natural resistance-associated macrophage protein)-like metal ion transporter
MIDCVVSSAERRRADREHRRRDPGGLMTGPRFRPTHPFDPPSTPIDHGTPGASQPVAESALEQLAREPNPVVRFFKLLGPGFITGASDDDPSGIGTYAVAGATFGYATLWTALVTFPLMASVQFMCAKVGMVSGMGLAGVLRHHYPRWLLYPTVCGLIAANTINAGADLGAIAAALNLLVPIPIVVLIIPVALVILALQLFGSYQLIARVFKWLGIALLAYVGAAVLAHPDWAAVVHGTFVPHLELNGQFLATLVAILGTTISPYLFFWQTNLEVEEEMAAGRTQLRERRGASDTELTYRAWDVNLGMLFSNAVMYFIILATGATLFTTGHSDINSAADAAEALRPVAGDLSAALLALGLIGTGFLAVPVLTGSAAYAVSEAFGWPFGLDKHPERARQFYGVIAGSTLVGIAMNFIGINPIEALFWAAVINGVLAPPLLALILLIANNPRVMQDRPNGGAMNALGWLTTGVMALAAAALVLTWGR